jgi:hypothetical protein
MITLLIAGSSFFVGVGLTTVLLYHSSTKDLERLRDEVDHLLESTEVDDYFRDKWSRLRDKF